MKIKIHVTKEIIMKGECGEPQKCAVALALSDIVDYVNVGCRSISGVIGGYKFYTILPQEATVFIDDFDFAGEDRGDLEPISFEIDLPDGIIEKIGIGEVYRILSESKTLELVP